MMTWYQSFLPASLILLEHYSLVQLDGVLTDLMVTVPALVMMAGARHLMGLQGSISWNAPLL